jgi:hypothetical protein
MIDLRYQKHASYAIFRFRLTVLMLFLINRMDKVLAQSQSEASTIRVAVSLVTLAFRSRVARR